MRGSGADSPAFDSSLTPMACVPTVTRTKSVKVSKVSKPVPSHLGGTHVYRSTPGHRRAALALAASVVCAVASVALLTSPATAASLVQVTNFGANPTNLSMHLYVPDNIPAGTRPPILVAVHYCTGSGPAFF